MSGNIYEMKDKILKMSTPKNFELPEIFKYEFDNKEHKWNRRDADITDYFNYGFNEETWKLYAKKVRTLAFNLHQTDYSLEKDQIPPEKALNELDDNLPIDLGGFSSPFFKEIFENIPEKFMDDKILVFLKEKKYERYEDLKLENFLTNFLNNNMATFNKLAKAIKAKNLDISNDIYKVEEHLANKQKNMILYRNVNMPFIPPFPFFYPPPLFPPNLADPSLFFPNSMPPILLEKKKDKSKSRSKSRSKDKSRHKEKEKNRKKEYEKEREKERQKEKEKNKEKEKEKEKDKDRDKDKDKEREKDKDKDKEREKEKEKEKERDRDRDRERERDKEKDKENKDREKVKHEKEKRNRERSQEREKRKKDKSKRTSKEKNSRNENPSNDHRKSEDQKSDHSVKRRNQDSISKKSEKSSENNKKNNSQYNKLFSKSIKDIRESRRKSSEKRKRTKNDSSSSSSRKSESRSRSRSNEKFLENINMEDEMQRRKLAQVRPKGVISLKQRNNDFKDRIN